jgi:hypothetical protein
MTVGAQERDVVRLIVSPIAVDVFQFEWDSAGHRIAFTPAAPRAHLSVKLSQIASQKPKGRNCRVDAIQEQGLTTTIFRERMTRARTKASWLSLDKVRATFERAVRAHFLTTHRSTIRNRCDTVLAQFGEAMDQ